MLATNLLVTGMDLPIRTILVTSPHAQDGKSQIVSNLAAALAQRELKVIIVDADLRLPNQHRLFELEQDAGLTGSLLDGHAEKQLKRVGVDGLRVLTSGPLPPNPAEVVASVRMRNLLDELGQYADLVLIDCPPVFPIADATILASMVDGVVLVVRAHSTRRQEMRDAVESLCKVGCRMLGVVLNGVPGQNGRYYKYYGDSKREQTTGMPRMRRSLKSMVRIFGANRQ